MNLKIKYNSIIKKLVPKKWHSKIRNSRIYLKKRSDVTNVYHCCMHKSASQWMKSILDDPITFKYTGLKSFKYQEEWLHGHDPRTYDDRSFHVPFPEKTIVSPMYSDYPSFKSIPKPEKYRAFFVLRDPRDTVVSWYFSMRDSHPLISKRVKVIRKTLRKKTKLNGLKYAIMWLDEFGLFDAQVSWVDVENPYVEVVTYESLTGKNQLDVFRRLFNNINLHIPDDKLRSLLEKHSFGGNTGGREKGTEDTTSHRRKGVAGDWKNHFSKDLKRVFAETTSEVAKQLGYEPTL